MKLLVATDFSARSDRALRRAVLFARLRGAELTLMHALDNDVPTHLLKAARKEAAALLQKLSASVQAVDGVICSYVLVEESPAAAIVGAAHETDAGMIVIGEHRRQILKDVFVGTTAERTIRMSDLPVLMVCAPPAGHYEDGMLAIDLSGDSAEVMRKAHAVLGKEVSMSLVHAFTPTGAAMMTRAMVSEEQVAQHVEELAEEAMRGLERFADGLPYANAGLEVVPVITSRAEALLRAARDRKSDLLVVGAHRERGLKRMLGGTPEHVLGKAGLDVLVIPVDGV